MIPLLWQTALLLLVLMQPHASAAEGAFKARASLSSPVLPIDGETTLAITLTFPKGYRPDSQTIRERLLSYNGFGAPPFTLKSYAISDPADKDGSQEQTLTFILQPQSVGRYYLGPKTATFLAEDGRRDPAAIPVELLPVEITPVSTALTPQAMIAPFLGLAPGYPVVISYENKKNHLYDSAVVKRQTGAIAAAIDGKAFPWAPLAAAFIVALTAVLIFTVPTREKGVEQKGMDREEQEKEIRKTLKELAALAPQSPETARSYFMKVEESLKRLLDTGYDLKSFTSTSQELANDLSTLSQLPPQLRDKMIAVFATADRIKFARYRPGADDYAKAAEAAKHAAEADL